MILSEAELAATVLCAELAAEEGVSLGEAASALFELQAVGLIQVVVMEAPQ